MSKLIYQGGHKLERKIISVSPKRQITIPQKYFEALGFDNEAECVLQNNAIIIRPIRNQESSSFAEEILKDLIVQGFSGEELLAQFKILNKKVRPAVQTLIQEADNLARNNNGSTMSDIFEMVE